MNQHAVLGVVFDIRRYSIHDGPGIRTAVFLKGCPLACWWCHNPESQSPKPEMIVRESRCIRCGACVEACPENAITWAEKRTRTSADERGLSISAGDDVQPGSDCRNKTPVTDWDRCETVRHLRGRVLRGRAGADRPRDDRGRRDDEIERDIAFYDESGGGVTLSGGEPLAQREFTLALLRACKGREIHTALDTCGFAAWSVLDQVRPYVDLFLYDLKLMDDARHREVTGARSTPSWRTCARCRNAATSSASASR